MLDLVSGGRADFGTGESSSEAELGGFLRRSARAKRAMWEEGLRVALRCLTETPFTGHAGKYVTMPPRNVVPEAGAEAAPAGVGGVQPARHHPPRGAEGDRRARVRVHRSRGSAPLDDRLPRHAGERVRARSATRSTRTSRASPPSCATTTSRRRCGAGSRAPTSSGTRSRTTTCSVVTSPGATDVWAEYRAQRGDRGLRARGGRGGGARRRSPRRADRAGRRVLRPARRDRHARPDP